MRILEGVLNEIPSIPINDPQMVKAYADIDAYSQGLHPTIPAPQGFSAKNMGKNDLWIVATASVIGAKLVTADQDFAHLQGTVLADVEIVPVI